jgi:hypothetical protein
VLANEDVVPETKFVGSDRLCWAKRSGYAAEEGAVARFQFD